MDNTPWRGRSDPVPAFTDISKGFKTPSPCVAGLGSNHPCPPDLCPSLGRPSALITMMYSDLQGPEAGNETCHPHPSHPSRISEGRLPREMMRDKTTTWPPRACLLQVTHPGVPKSEEVQSSTDFQWNKILMERLTLQCLRYHTAIVLMSCSARWLRSVRLNSSVFGFCCFVF